MHFVRVQREARVLLNISAKFWRISGISRPSGWLPYRTGDRAAAATVLDVASGPGQPALTIAAALPSTSVIASDASEDMIATATGKAAGLPNVKTCVADAQALTDFADSSIDVVTCCYGQGGNQTACCIQDVFSLRAAWGARAPEHLSETLANFESGLTSG